MGLFSFKKKSTKQGHAAVQDNDVLVPSITKDFNLESFMASTDSSLMDDIMNELDSVNKFSIAIPTQIINKEIQPSLSSFYSSSVPSSNSSETNSLKSPEAIVNIEEKIPKVPVIVNQLSASPSPPPPKVHITFSKSISDLSKISLKKSSTQGTLNNENDSSDEDDDENNELLLKPQLVNSNSKEKVRPVSMVATAGSVIKKSATSVNVRSQKEVMDRMKERHRLETRRSLQPSKSMDMTPYRIRNSPSIPIMPTFIENQRPIVQSQSFTGGNAVVMPVQQPIGNMIRSTYSLNDIHNNSQIPHSTSQTRLNKPQQPSLMKTSIMNHKRNSYIQNNGNNNGNSEPNIKQSPSAYSIFSQQDAVQQQQQQLLIQQQLIIQQQQIEIQQQQLNEQYLLQQQKIQHLKLQQQQQQLINQAIIDSTKSLLNVNKKPLYERSSLPHNRHHHHHHHHRHFKVYSTQNEVVEKKPKEEKEIKIPTKLKNELKEMKASKTRYSLPDITILSKEEEEVEQEEQVDEIESLKTIQQIDTQKCVEYFIQIPSKNCSKKKCCCNNSKSSQHHRHHVK